MIELNDLFDATDIPYIIDVINYQECIMTVTEDTIDDTVEALAENETLKTQFGQNCLIHNIYIAAETHINRVSLIAKLVASLASKPDFEFLKKQLLDIPLRILEQTYVLTLLFECHQFGLFTDEDINQAFLDYIYKYKNMVTAQYAILIWFLPIIERVNPELYNKMMSEEKKGFSAFESFDTKSFFDSFEVNKANHDELIRIGYLQGTIPYLIRKDDINAFQKLAASPDFYINQIVPKSMFYRSVFKWQKLRLIHFAALCGAKEIFTYLLLNGADYDYQEHEAKLITYAIAGGNIEIVTLLDSKPGIDFNGALHVAAFYHQTDIFQWIYDMKTQDLESLYLNDGSVLNWATISNNISSIVFCLQHNANVNKMDDGFFTPLHHAAKNCRREAIRILVRVKGLKFDPNDRKYSHLINLATTHYDFTEALDLFHKRI